MTTGLPAQVRAFIESQIDSVEQLEILLLFYRNPERVWSISQICSEIRGTLSSTHNRVSSLKKHGLISTINEKDHEGYRYSPPDAEVNAVIGQLAEEYRVRRVRVIDAIYAPPTGKMLDFMEAFRIRKPSEDN